LLTPTKPFNGNPQLPQMCIVVNLFGGPGVGKSTIAAQLFSMLKWNNISCELITEFAKELVWAGSHSELDDQLYVFARQYHKQWVMKGQVDIIITDSPILLSLIYGKERSTSFHGLVLDKFHEFRNRNILLQREKPYHEKGRMQTHDESKVIDTKMKLMLDKFQILHSTMPGNESTAQHIYGSTHL